MAKVLVYSMEMCSYCHLLKELLHNNDYILHLIAILVIVYGLWSHGFGIIFIGAVVGTLGHLCSCKGKT